MGQGTAGNGMPGGASSYTNINDWGHQSIQGEHFQERQHPQQLQQHLTTPVQLPMTVHQAAAPKKKAAESLVAVASADAAAGNPAEAARILTIVAKERDNVALMGRAAAAVAVAVAPALPEPEPEPEPERASEKAGRDLDRPIQSLTIPDILTVAKMDAVRQREFRQLARDATESRDGAGDDATRHHWQLTIDKIENLEAHPPAIPQEIIDIMGRPVYEIKTYEMVSKAERKTK
ncbi:hypothetical protein PG997_013955 [Apiospora hydei]|uniref:Uncharacterized protein n=1 Tax=Apiospora hydei TaxID=1337664 RepID=A0ABR1V7R9_9PEZI